jgi:carbon storage regulator
MLVLTRKSGQEIVIDGNIRLSFTVKGDKVKVGIDAPPHVRIDRDEIARQVSVVSDRGAARPHPVGA